MLQIILAGFIFFLSSCSSGLLKQEVWTGFVYPDRNYLPNSRIIGEFQNLEDCRNSALGWLEDRNLLRAGTYECGLNCKYRPDMDIYVCEETVD